MSEAKVISQETGVSVFMKYRSVNGNATGIKVFLERDSFKDS